ncbi:MAG: RluA family pseudouridine synthase [Pelagibacterales bacterium]|nr:RluA family pseudouridine synthase [Pelagibacterales bacterium]
MKNITFYKFEVYPDKALRIDQIIASQLPEYSRSRIKNWINEEKITINGKSCTPKDKIVIKSSVEVKILENEELDIESENIPIEILYADDDFLIINKESGMVTHTAPGNFTGTLQNALLYKYPELRSIPRAGIIHRLDKNTSGLLIITKNLKSHNELTKQIQLKKITKKYDVLVTGIISNNMIINKNIGRHKVNRKKMSVCDNGKESISKIIVKENYAKSSYLEVELITGRTHQIRVHLSHLGHPVIGDKTYGFKKNIFNSDKGFCKYLESYDSHALHAKYLSFKHPTSQEKFSIEAPLPDSFTKIKSYIKEAHHDS